MKEIKKIQIWSNGENIELNYINIHIKFDDLINVCVFSYDLLKDEQSIVNGEIILNGNEYLEWSGNNDEAFNIILQKLNLELI
jgi:hypothetical protein